MNFPADSSTGNSETEIQIGCKPPCPGWTAGHEPAGQGSGNTGSMGKGFWHSPGRTFADLSLSPSWHSGLQGLLLVIMLGLLFPASHDLLADNAPEKLASREHVKTFKEVTRRLNCFCGCHGLVSDCLHVDEHCFAVQTRRFIENRILEGMSAEEIVDGFVHGFEGEHLRDPILQEWARKGRQDLIAGVTDGFGESILHHDPPSWPVYVSLVAGLLIFSLLIWRLWALRLSPADRRDLESRANGRDRKSSDESEEDWLGSARSQLDNLER